MSDNTEPQATLVVDFGGEAKATFNAHRYANQFLLVRHLDAIGEGGYKAIEAVTVLALDQVEPEEKPRLEQFLYENGRSDDYANALYEALSDCWTGETHLPLVQSSDSSVTTSSPETESTSTDDSSSEDMGEPGDDEIGPSGMTVGQERMIAWVQNSG